MKKKNYLRVIYNFFVLFLLLAGTYLVIDHFVYFGKGEFTDNATVQQHITPINTRVQGFIREIRFQEFQQVHKGDTLVIIEDSEFRLRLAQAEADLANALAGKEVVATGIKTTQQSIGVTSARIDEARVQLENACREEARYSKLLKEDAVTPQQYEQVHTAYLSAQARYSQAKRSVGPLASVKEEQHHRLGQNKANIDVARLAVKLARLNLSYTVIVATADGFLGKKSIHEGQLVQPGQTLVDIVDNSDLWVVANYRETQLAHIAEGYPVEVKVDAVPDVTFEGIVERISDATGSAFSIIPQDNATGNFVKVEQRIPIRIRLKHNSAIASLRAGMNVLCTVREL